MCPDRELLSAWIDGEVPSPWNEAIERHLDGCASCAEAVRSLRALGERLRVDSAAMDPAAEAAAARVYGRVAPSLRPSAGLGRAAPRTSSALWARRLAVPIPTAAAAALMIAMMALALVASGRRNAEMRMAMERAYEATQVATAGMGIESVIDYLAQQNSAVNINITLPPEAFGGSAGEPFIVREADYQGGSRR